MSDPSSTQDTSHRVNVAELPDSIGGDRLPVMTPPRGNMPAELDDDVAEGTYVPPRPCGYTGRIAPFARNRDTSGRRPRVVIVGGGFGGLEAAKRLRKADVDVVLVDRRNFHLFQPLLYQVATGELSPANIAAPIRAVLRKCRNATVLMGEVTDIDVAGKRLIMTDDDIEYDYLILAAGATHHYFGNDDWAPLAPGLKTIENATEIRRQVLGAFEAAERCDNVDEIRELLTFVVVGAGPTGCEMAGALSEIARHTLRCDFRCIDPALSHIILVNSDDHPLEVYAEPLPQRAAADLKRLGVQLINDTKVTDIQPTHVELTSNSDGSKSTLATRTVIWAAGVRASGLATKLSDATGIELARGGRVPVAADTSVAQHPNIFVVGDMAMFDHDKHGDLPGLAPVAMQMGKHAAKCIAADLKQRSRTSFKYRDKGSMAVIGRFSAVGEIGRFKVKGFIAWALWLGVHLMFIAMFRNRVLVLMQWGWTFLTRDRSSRLISDGPRATISTMETAAGWDEDPALPTVRPDYRTEPQPAAVP